MLKHLERLKGLRKEIATAGMLKKADLAVAIGDESYKLAVEIVRELITLKQEVEKWKAAANPPR